MNFFHGSNKRNKKIFVRISVRFLAIFYLLFLIAFQLQSPTTAYYSDSNKLNGTLAAINDFGETEVMESSEVEGEVKEIVKEEISEEVIEEVNEEIDEEIIEEVEEEAIEEKDEEAIEEKDEEIKEEENTEDNDSSDKSNFEENNEN